MLNKLRIFSKSRLAIILVAIIIIPFVFWGMGNVFTSGNTNNVAKINNKTISTKDFLDYVNSLQLNEQIIQDNIDNNIFEQLLSQLISKNILNMEINKLGIIFSEKDLANIIKKNINFTDSNNEFSRLKYEKFLLENNISAPLYEYKLKNIELQKKLYFYINGGIKSPNFLVNKTYIEQNKKIEIEYINLNDVYKKEFTKQEIDKFINENIEILKNEYIDFSYVKIEPINLVEQNEFNNEYFKKIDEIENLILNGSNIDKIASKYNLKLTKKYNFILETKDNELEEEIYSKRNEEKIQLLDKNDFFVLFEIKKIDKILPDRNSLNFINKVNDKLFLEEKINLNNFLLTQIQNRKFNDKDFHNLINDKSKINRAKINSIKDDSIFNNDSVNLLYSISKNNFLLMTDVNNNIFISKVINVDIKNLKNNQDEIDDFSKQSNITIRNDLYTSYDYFLNNSYKIKIYEKTLERVKNYFR